MADSYQMSMWPFLVATKLNISETGLQYSKEFKKINTDQLIRAIMRKCTLQIYMTTSLASVGSKTDQFL